MGTMTLISDRLLFLHLPYCHPHFHQVISRHCHLPHRRLFFSILPHHHLTVFILMDMDPPITPTMNWWWTNMKVHHHQLVMINKGSPRCLVVRVSNRGRDSARTNFA